MAGVRFDTSQVRKLEADLTTAPVRTIRKATSAVRKTVFDIEGDGKVFAPVDTGNLKNSISSEFHRGGLAGETGPTAEYGHFVEEGTSRMAPQPYMSPAADRREPGFVKAMGQLAGDFL